MTVIDSYLDKLNPGQRDSLERIRKIVKQTVPDAEETISYGMPTFKLKGKRLIYFAAYKDHMSIFGRLGSLEKKLGNYKLSHKGTLQFTEDNPIPESLIKEIITTRLKGI